MTDRQFRSVCTTRLATLRWTKSSPGRSPTIWFAGTRLSEQPIHRYSGDCCCASFAKKSGSCRRMRSAQVRLFSNSCGRCFMAPSAALDEPAERAGLLARDRGALRGIELRAARDEPGELGRIAVLLQHVVERGHPALVAEAGAGPQPQQLLRRVEVTRLHRRQERRLVLDAVVDAGAVAHEEPDRGEVAAEGRGPQAVVGIAAALQQELGQRQVLPAGDRVPEWRCLPPALAEGLAVEVEPRFEQHLGGLHAVPDLRRLRLRAATDVQPVAAALVADLEERG